MQKQEKVSKVLLVSTCGTSLLTNVLKKLPGNQLGREITQQANQKKLDDIPEKLRGGFVELMGHCREKLSGCDSLDQVKEFSAELNSLIGYYQGNIHRPHDMHFLICTDTWLGEQTASILCEWLVDKKLNAQVVRIDDLQTAELTGFHLAMSEIVRWCDETLLGFRENQYHIVFNLTGGFKSIQGFMQTLGMFYADESIYTFESGQHLLSLPRIPVRLDVESTLRKGLRAFRRAGVGLVVNESEIEDLPETLFMVMDKKATLSPWGELVWKQVGKTILGEKLLEPISPRLVWGDKFNDSLKGLDSDQFAILNRQLDELTRCIEDGTNLRGLRFHALKNPQKNIVPSTHEIHVWPSDPRRVFGHYEGNKYRVDRLDDHLPES